MTSESRGIPRWPKWALFIGFLMTVPVPYFMVVVGGLVPLIFILVLAAQGLVVALPKFTAEGFWMLGILWGHVLVLGALLHWAAAGIHRILFRFLPRRPATVLVLGLAAGLFALALTFDIYRIPGHNHAPPANLLRLIRVPAP